MNKKDQERFSVLRKKVADYIRWYLEDDCGHKSYEGTWEALASYPSYFEDETGTAEPDFYRLTLHCYVLGPSRHYDWDGSTFGEALDECERDIDQWIRSEMEDRDS